MSERVAPDEHRGPGTIIALGPPGMAVAEEIVAELAYECYAPATLPPWEDLDGADLNDLARLLAYQRFGRSVIAALVEQGWTPPGEDAQP